LGVVLRFAGEEDSPLHRLRAQQAEKIRSYVLCAQRARLTEAGDAGGIVETGQGDIFEDVILLYPVDLLCNGRRVALIGMSLFGLPNDDELFGLGIGQRTIQEGVQYAEDGAVGGDA